MARMPGANGINFSWDICLPSNYSKGFLTCKIYSLQYSLYFRHGKLNIQSPRDESGKCSAGDILKLHLMQNGTGTG